MRRRFGFDVGYWTHRAAFGIADQAMFSGANFLVGIALARWLPVNDFGWFSLLFSTFLIAASFHNALVIEPMSVLGPSRFRHRFGAYGRHVVTLHFLLSAALGGLLAACAALFTTGDDRVASLAAAASLPFMLLVWLVRRYFYTETKPGRALAASAIYLAAVLAGLALLRGADGLSTASAFAVLAAAGLLAGMPFLMRREDMSPAGDAAASDVPGLRTVARDHAVYGRWQLGADMISAIGVHGPVFWTAAYLGLEATAALRAAANFMLPMAQVLTAISTLVLPVLARDFAERRLAQMRRKSRVVSLSLLGLAAIYFALLLIFGGPIEGLVYQGKYAAYTWLIPALGLIPLISAASIGWSMRLRAVQRPKHYLIAAIAVAAVSLLSAIVLIPPWGLPGAAATSILSYLAGAGALFAMERRWVRKPALHGSFTRS